MKSQTYPRRKNRLTFEHDQYQRYTCLQGLLETVFVSEDAGSLVSVLDVGSGPEQITTHFLDDRFHIRRADVGEFDQPGILRLVRGEPIPAADDEFDVVMALEVLEHIPSGQRAFFVSECIRVARQVAVFSTPYRHPEVERAEEKICEVFELYTKQEHPFLSEHKQFGLVDPADVHAAVGRCNRECFESDNCRLDYWLAGQMIDNLLHTVAYGQNARAEILKQFNLRAPLRTEGAVHYRKFYTIPTSDKTTGKIASWHSHHDERADVHDVIDPLYQLSRISAEVLARATRPKIQAAVRGTAGRVRRWGKRLWGRSKRAA